MDDALVARRAALKELSEKTLQQIQIETAYKWAYRAWAAHRLAQDAQSSPSWAADAVEYEHEAIEHAALADDQEVLADVRLIIADGKRII